MDHNFYLNRKGEKMFEELKENKIVLIIVLSLLGLGAFFLLKPWEVVDSGNKGLKFTFGKLHNEVLDEGIAFKIPLVQTIEEITIRPIELSHTIEVGQNGAITKDNQNVGASITLFYRYDYTALVSLWRDVGLPNLEGILRASIKEEFKKQIGKYTIFEVAPIQEKIRQEMLAGIVEINAAKYPIEITELKITNYDWPDSFEKQIEKTMQMAQEVKQKEQGLLIAEQEAQKQVKQAEAAKQSMITVAEGEKASAALKADAKALEGEGIRKYNEAIKANMEIELAFRKLEIDKIKAQKWDGKYVPNNMYGPIPLSSGGLQP